MDRSAHWGPECVGGAAPQSAPTATASPGVTVLVVDDEAEVRQVLHEILTRGG